MVKKDPDYKKQQNPKSFGAFLKKRAPIYLGLIGLFLLFAYPALTEKDLNSILDDSGITILEVIEEKINEKYEGQKIFDDEETWSEFVVENIENRNEGFTHEVVFLFNAENNQSMMYGWYVNVENGEISPIDLTSKSIQQTVDYFD